MLKVYLKMRSSHLFWPVVLFLLSVAYPSTALAQIECDDYRVNFLRKSEMTGDDIPVDTDDHQSIILRFEMGFDDDVTITLNDSIVAMKHLKTHDFFETADYEIDLKLDASQANRIQIVADFRCVEFLVDSKFPLVYINKHSEFWWLVYSVFRYTYE